MIKELESAAKQIEGALLLLKREREAWAVKLPVNAIACQAEATKVLEALHADVMAWRCILIVALRERDRARAARQSLIGRAWRRMRATLL